MSTRRLAATSATVGLFALAILGWFSGNSMFVCAVRALVGAIVLYFVVAIGARIAVGIVVDAIVRSAPRGKAPEDNAR